MKKFGFMLGMAMLAAGWLQAGTCSSTMSLAALSVSSLANGCDFNGFNFNNFQVDNYIATPTFTGGPQYDPIINSGANVANYLANFAVMANGGVSVTFTGAVTQTDGAPAWTIQTGGAAAANANFSFEIKYNIASGTDANPANNKNATSLKTMAATLGSVAYSGPTTPGSDASATFSKVAQFNAGAQLQTVTDKLILSSGSQTKILNLLPNNGSIAITDNLVLQISDTEGATLTAGSLGNAFDTNAIPEPVTMSLTALGLGALAMIRRRYQR
jgi:hypothetical protein